MIINFVFLLIFLAIFAILFNTQEKFGKTAKGKHLEKIKNSRYFKNGQFHNMTHTPNLAPDASIMDAIFDIIFGRSNRNKPTDIIPTQKTDLKNIPIAENIIVWFGHSSYFLQLDGKRFLVDPVLCGSASPFPFSIKSYKGTDIYSAEELPEIDFLIITHDHWDHLDFQTVKKLKSKIKKVITGLGNAAHLEYWGFSSEQILEHDWNETSNLGNDFFITSKTSRHFSGRGLFDRKKTLWSSFILQTPNKKLFLGGDSGYDTHFEEIGNENGPFDLAILECGQYNKLWKHLHMHPEEVLQAAQDLKAKALMPVHWGKFSLSNHAWDEPIKKITELCKSYNFPIVSPLIGQAVNLNNPELPHKEWWLEIN
jgi:L-ascorbate metabolism protein UlaG (beta-lactamase superfamily)